MFPFFDVGPWHISTYRFVYAAMVVIAGMFAYVRLRRAGIPARHIERGLGLTILGIMVGLGAPSLFANGVRFIATGEWSGEVEWRVAYGLATGIAVGMIYSHRVKGSFWRAADAAIPAFPLGYFIARIGCFAAGCCQGKPTDSQLGMYLPDQYGFWTTRYPTQMMSGLSQAAIFIGLLLFECYRARAGKDEHSPFHGFVFLLYVLLFCLERFAVEFFRQDSVPVFGIFSQTHLFTFAGMVFATVLLSWNLRAARRLQGAKA